MGPEEAIASLSQVVHMSRLGYILLTRFHYGTIVFGKQHDFLRAAGWCFLYDASTGTGTHVFGNEKFR
eukprot:m.189229 g.189229  ORF g.189229 m.189229 type:complete len:68 (+) comp15104_c0_seq3:1358-1561(+)